MVTLLTVKVSNIVKVYTIWQLFRRRLSQIYDLQQNAPNDSTGNSNSLSNSHMLKLSFKDWSNASCQVLFESVFSSSTLVSKMARLTYHAKFCSLIISSLEMSAYRNNTRNNRNTMEMLSISFKTVNSSYYSFNRVCTLMTCQKFHDLPRLFPWPIELK